MQESPVGEVAPRMSRLRACLLLALGLALTGGPIGAFWASFAPPVHGVVALARNGERVQAALGSEAENLFIAPILLLGLLTMLAVVAGTAAWQWRAHRGPAMVVGLSAGLTAAAVSAALAGRALVHRRYGVIDVEGAPVSPEHRVHYVVDGPPVFLGNTPAQLAITLLLPAATAVLLYGFCTLWCARDDLGAYPAQPVPRRVPPPPAVRAEDGVAPLR